MVPVRLIATADETIRNHIIKGTNRQTQVTDEQLFALSDFPKKLEVFFPTFADNAKLYYERRSRQYNNVPGIEKVRVINMTILVRAFAAMFKGLPHRTTRNYKMLLKGVGQDIFGKDDKLEPYYLAGYAHYRLDFMFRNGLLDAALKVARYHILYAYRLSVGDVQMPRLNSNEMVRFCKPLMERLWDDEKTRRDLENVAKQVGRLAKGDLHRDNIRTESFTEAVHNHFSPS